MTRTFTARARTIGITGDNWPYGANIDHQSRVDLLAWAKHNKLR